MKERLYAWLDSRRKDFPISDKLAAAAAETASERLVHTVWGNGYKNQTKFWDFAIVRRRQAVAPS